MVKFNGEKWVAETEEEGTNAYPPINTLLRHGPKPFFTRVFQPDDYEYVDCTVGCFVIRQLHCNVLA